MSKNKRKTGFAVWFVLVGFPVVAVLGLRELGVGAALRRALKALGAIETSEPLSVDIGSGAFLFASARMEDQPDIFLRHSPPGSKVSVRNPDCDWLAGTISFPVIPEGEQRGRTFESFDVAAAVEKGLSHDPCPDGRPPFGSWSVRTNAADRCWTVVCSGVHPGGTVSLSIGGKKVSVETRASSLKKLSSLWKGDRLALFGDEFRLNGKRMRRGDVRRPDPTTGTPGFRVLGTAPSCIWLEIIYSEPFGEIVSRTRWPGLSVVWTGDAKSVRFEGGGEVGEGKSVEFPEKDRLVLSKDGVLSPNAVRFSYFSRKNAKPLELLVLTLH